MASLPSTSTRYLGYPALRNLNFTREGGNLQLLGSLDREGLYLCFTFVTVRRLVSFFSSASQIWSKSLAYTLRGYTRRSLRKFRFKLLYSRRVGSICRACDFSINKSKIIGKNLKEHTLFQSQIALSRAPRFFFADPGYALNRIPDLRFNFGSAQLKNVTPPDTRDAVQWTAYYNLGCFTL